MKTVALTRDEAREIAVRAQGIGNAALARRGARGVLHHVGAVQLDTIAALARAHELTAFARAGAITKASIEQAYWGMPPRAFEYYAHAASVIPLELWPYMAFRRRAIRERFRKYEGNVALPEVRAALRDGPLTASDVGGARRGIAGWWNWSDAKQALELLWWWGEAACVTRRGWKRVYDLAERVVPAALRDHEPSDEECYRVLIERSAKALGVGTARDIADYYRLWMRPYGIPADARPLLARVLQETLVPVTVEGWDEPAWAHASALRKRSPVVHAPVLVGPFDPLVWERPRAARLFGFVFQIEAYLKKEDRQHGYYSMPLLADGRIIGRCDPARDGRTLVARHITLDDASHAEAMASALREAASWVGCGEVRVDGVGRVVGAVRRAVQG